MEDDSRFEDQDAQRIIELRHTMIVNCRWRWRWRLTGFDRCITIDRFSVLRIRLGQYGSGPGIREPEAGILQQKGQEGASHDDGRRCGFIFQWAKAWILEH